MLERLLPVQAGNRFEGHRAALWLLWLYVGLKLLMSVNSVVLTAKVAQDADGIALSTFSPAAATEVLTLFALVGLGQLALAFVALAVLIRYRGLVPLIYLVLLAEALVRRLIVLGYAPVRTEAGTGGFYINIGLLTLLGLGLVLSLLPVGQKVADR
jgi:hypothetical protein